MAVDIVVVAYRSRAHLRQCIEALSCAADMHVVVVDNDCPESSTDTVSDLPVEIVRMGRNAGFGAACNVGARVGSARAILFLNPDAVISAAAVRALERRLETDLRCGAVGPHLLETNGDTQPSMRRAPTLRSTFGEALFLHHLAPWLQWPTEIVRNGYERPAEAEWLSGAVLCVRRSSFEGVGGFDERLFLYSEDTDLCLRLREAGFTLVYEPAATARHQGGGSGPRVSLLPLKTEARLTYARLHEHGWRYALFRVAYVLHEAFRLPVAAKRSSDELRARAHALRVAVGAGPRLGPTNR